MKKIYKIIFFVFLILVAPKNIAQINKISESQLKDIDNMVENLSQQDKFSGVVLIAQSGNIIYQKAVGFSNKESKSQNKMDTKFCLGSMNKMFTGLSIAQLAEKGKLKYKDKVCKYLPELPKKIFSDVTIHQLLTHSAGTGDIFTNPKYLQIADTAKTINSYLKIGLTVPLQFKPGTKIKYSNYGYIILGALVEKISKMSYYDYVKKNIFEVSNMNNTDSYERDQNHENLAIGYANPLPKPDETPNSVLKKMEREPNTKMLEVKGTSAGGGYSTAQDLLKFSEALFSGKLISKSGLEILTTGKVILLPAFAERGLPEVKYAYGFSELFKNNCRVIGHNGGAPGVDTQMELYPNEGYTVIALANYERATMPITMLVKDIITQDK